MQLELNLEMSEIAELIEYLEDSVVYEMEEEAKEFLLAESRGKMKPDFITEPLRLMHELLDALRSVRG